ncbi:MAG: hypothetical protein H6670_17285 [Anaerolineaceae bacterium]|nr:hypothetical protein [Anaerolineaceae bacterium]
MKFPYLIVLVLLLLSHIVTFADDSCIEPRNSYSGDVIVGIEWAPNSQSIFVSTMGRVTIFDLTSFTKPPIVHEVCSGRFPVIGVGNAHYAIGGDFRSSILLFDLETHQLINEIEVQAENVNSIAFNETDSLIVISISDWDEGGFFDINRMLEIITIDNGEVVATLDSERDESAPYLSFKMGVAFMSDGRVLATGLDQEDSFVETQPIVILWDWQNSESSTVEVEPNKLIGLLDEMSLVTLEIIGRDEILLQTTNLESHDPLSSASYAIAATELADIELATTSELSLIAIENSERHVWIIDLSSQTITNERQLEGYAIEMAFNQSGNQLAIGYGSGNVEVWNLETGEISPIGNALAHE